MKKKFLVFKFYARGNGGMECYTTYRAYDNDVRKNKNLEYIIDSILGGDYPEGIRSTHCELVARPSKDVLDKLRDDLEYNIRNFRHQIKENKALLKLLK